MTRRRRRWEKEEAEIKAGKIRPVLRAALREGKKMDAERKKAEDAASVGAESGANLPPDPDP